MEIGSKASYKEIISFYVRNKERLQCFIPYLRDFATRRHSYKSLIFSIIAHHLFCRMNFSLLKRGFLFSGKHLIALSVALLTVGAISVVAADASTPSGTNSGGLLVKTGQQVVFLGDSTTQSGWASASGFIHLVKLGLAKENIAITASQFGKLGCQTKELPDLYQKNVATMTPKPDWLVISCGLDDVSHATVAPDLSAFQQDMKALVVEAKAAGQQVMILTTSVANERGDDMDQKLAPYNDALRALAKSENCILADVNASMKAALPAAPPLEDGRRLRLNDPTLNSHGQRVVATEVLKAFGASDAQLADMGQAWLDASGSAEATTNIPLQKVTLPITLREYEGLEVLAVNKHQSLQPMLGNLCGKDIVLALRTLNTPADTKALQDAVQALFEKDVNDELKIVPAVAPAEAPAASSTSATHGGILVKSGQKVAFMGDSITAFGWSHPYGYVNLVVRGLANAGVQVVPVPAGVGGNTSRDMLARLQKSVLDEKPDWLTLSCGVNDVWHGVAGVDLETYKKNITSIVDQAQKANIQVMILTPTMIQEGNNAFNDKLATYVDFLRDLTKERKLPLADLNADEHEALMGLLPGRHLAADGVHMNPRGDHMMALGVLKAFGLTDAQLAKVEASWLDEPNGAVAEGAARLMGSAPITLRESDALENLAQANKQTLIDYLSSIYFQALLEQGKASATETSLEKLQALAQVTYAQKIADLVRNASTTTVSASTK